MKGKDRGRTSLRVVGLFAGVGGFETGLAAAGHRTIRLCELDPAARAVLERRFPGVPIDEDIRRMRRLPADTDLVSAGFPCQDLSQAGRRQGLRGKHSSLIESLFQLLEGNRVEWVVLENVPFMLYLQKGRTMRRIVDRLEELGYRWAYRIIDTRAFGLPQRRRRVFLVASLYGDPRSVLLSQDDGETNGPSSRNGAACGFYWTEGNSGLGWATDAVPPLKGGSQVGIPSPPAIVMPGGRIVMPEIRDAERLQGFKPSWTQPAEMRGAGNPGARWRLVGNAVTVPVARWIGRRLAAPKPYRGNPGAQLTAADPWPRAAWSMGEGRFVAQVSEWPVAVRCPPLSEFLRFEPTWLSARATSGFLRRLTASTLNVEARFIHELERHLRFMRRLGQT